MTKRILYWVFALTGWVLAVYLFNQPTAPVRFTDRPAVEAKLFDSGIARKIVEWDEGKYTLFANGAESVEPYWGPLSMAMDPPKGWCPQEVFVYATSIGWTVCYNFDKVGGDYGSRSELSSAAEHVLLKGRSFAKEYWGRDLNQRAEKE